MNKSTLFRTILIGAFGAVAMTASVGASAHGREAQWSPPGHAWGHSKHRHYPVVRERVIVRQAPAYYGRPAYYERPAYYPYYPARPAVVIGVDIPPVVIPLW